MKAFKKLNTKFYFSKYFSSLNLKNDLTPDFTLNNDITIAKKQIYWRVRNIGQRELELLIGDWWEINSNKLTFDEIKAFNSEVLEMDNPSMNKYFVKLEEPENNLIYTRKILGY